MRSGFGGLALACVLMCGLLAACSPQSTPPPAPTGLSLPLAEGGHGVLEAKTAKITVKGPKGDYTADVSATPNWWVGGGEVKIVWYAGLSQTKRFFVIANEAGDPKDRPAFLAHPEEGVREVAVAFDGGALSAVRPDTARAAFKIPAGAKAVTEVRVAFGPADSPQMLDWR